MANTDDDKPCYFTIGGARKVKRLVDRFDGKPPASGGSQGGGNGWTPSIVRAQVTTAIPTGSFASPSSSGRAKIAYLIDGTWTLEADPVVVYNQYTLTSSLPVGRAIFMAWICGTWWILESSCS